MMKHFVLTIKGILKQPVPACTVGDSVISLFTLRNILREFFLLLKRDLSVFKLACRRVPHLNGHMCRVSILITLIYDLSHMHINLPLHLDIKDTQKKELHVIFVFFCALPEALS